MRSTNKNGIALFVECCVANGMRNVVCSPGSRNAPIVIAFDEHPKIETLVIHDERCAAFYALGMSISSGLPVGMVCTSGSASLNYYPAVAEAYYQCVPIVAITADRPAEWINQGEGQSIVQEEVYKNHLRGSLTLSETLDSEGVDSAIQNINAVFQMGCGDWSGPMHFNAPLSEPLYNEVDYQELGMAEVISESELEFELQDDLKRIWQESERIMVLCGQMNYSVRFERLINELSQDPSVVVISESTANIQGRNIISCIDRTLARMDMSEISSYCPDLLITFGTSIISKRIKSFLRNNRTPHHWKIGFEFPDMDTYQVKTKSLEVEKSQFLFELLQNKQRLSKTNFSGRWREAYMEAKDMGDKVLVDSPYSDLAVYNSVMQWVPDDTNLHMGNSSVVRYCQLFDSISGIRYFSNRGVSGIDGCLSTCCGVAFLDPEKLNLIIIGDTSFLYDSNALWNENLNQNLRIIVVNNGGGGIFRYIEGPDKSEKREKYFEARHPYSAEYICKAFRIDYERIDNIKSLNNCLPEFLSIGNSKGPRLIEVFTPYDINDEVLRDYFKQIQLSS
jgi:2-succinyl-5-enolpyruvyl-6-hydroxy-3-cyclohexene-1-carboxylate synthase